MNTRSKNEIKDIVVFFRLDLYNSGLSCGGKAIRNKMRRWGVKPLLSVSSIEQILRDKCLTNGRTGYCPQDYPKNKTLKNKTYVLLPFGFRL